MDVTGQFPQVGVLFAQDRLISVLEEVPMTAVSAIEINHIASEELPHALGDRLSAGLDQEMEMVGKERPGADHQAALSAKGGKTVQEIIPVLCVPEDLGPFDPSADEMM